MLITLNVIAELKLHLMQNNVGDDNHHATVYTTLLMKVLLGAKRLAACMKYMHHCYGLHIIKYVLHPLATVL